MNDHQLEDLAYQYKHDRGAKYYQHKGGSGLDSDLEYLFGWDSFPPQGKILELGCGDGFVSAFLAGRGLQVEGVDCSPTAIQGAKSNFAADGLVGEFQVADVCERLPFESDSFDFLLDSHCLHCITDYNLRIRFLSECFRVLRPNGRLFVATMAAQPMNWIEEGGVNQRNYEKDPKGCWRQSNVYDGSERRAFTRVWITEDLLRSEVAAAGFTIEKFEVFAPEADRGDKTFLVWSKKQA